MSKFIVNPQSRATFEMYVTERNVRSMPCRTVVGVGVPQNLRFEGKPINPQRQDVPRKTTSGPGSFRVWLITAHFNQHKGCYEITYIQTKRDEVEVDVNWRQTLHTIGWLAEGVNKRIEKALGFRLRPNPVVSEHVTRARKTGLATRCLMASAVRYHLNNGATQDEAVRLVITRAPRQKGYEGKKQNFRPKQGRNKGKQSNRKTREGLNKPFAALNV